MNINKIKNNQQTFGSKVSINARLAYHYSAYKTQGKALLKKIKQLEENGNDDVVSLSIRTIEDEKGYNDYITMDVFEKRGNKIYSNESILEIPIMVEGQYVEHKRYSLNKAYKEAKATMVELKRSFNSFIPYL